MLWYLLNTVTALFGVLQEPICYGIVAIIWDTAGCFGVLQEPICYGIVWGTADEAPTIAGMANQNAGTPVHLGTPVAGKTLL